MNPRFCLLGILGAVALSVFLSSCSNDDPTSPAPPQESPFEYPYTLPVLHPDTVSARLAAFSARNPGVCARMDHFGRLMPGICGGSGAGDGCPDSATAAAIALAFLGRNRDFFYLPSDLPAVRTARPLIEGRWRVTFEPRQTDGYTEKGGAVIVDLRTDVYRVAQGVYPPGRVPGSPILTPADARALVPYSQRFLCWTWMDCTLDGEPTLQAVPWVVATQWGPIRLEFRLAYRFFYSNQWVHHVFERCIDAVTGEEIYSHPLIFC
jgi:hypothetical protein